jgi:DNA-binding CsgD family transcriptional regulator
MSGTHTAPGEFDGQDSSQNRQQNHERPSTTVGQLWGRQIECGALDSLVANVLAGQSGVLVIRGEEGVGKTALLEHLVQHASGCRITRATSAQSETELAYAGLHQLCAPLLDDLERVPTPQRHALRTAVGLNGGPTPDRFLVALAVLSLLSEVSEERPLLCVMDDGQWLDRASAQALAFVGRRLGAQSVGLVLAARTPSADLAGLPELMVQGLREADARALFASVLNQPLDARIRDQIVSESRGNPLALMELGWRTTAAELAGGFGMPKGLSWPGTVEDRFRLTLEALPPETRLLLLVAAADPVGDPTLMWRAAERLGVGFEALGPATQAGVLDVGARVRFRDLQARWAVYRTASPADCQRAHAALAAATDPELDPDRRAWHRAQAAPGLDDDVAAALERSTNHAQRRGGAAAAAAFLHRAAGLTSSPALRAQRALDAAWARHNAGAPEATVELLGIADAGPLDELGRARLDVLRGQVAFASRRGSDAPWLLLRAAKRLEPLDVRLARDTYLDALSAARYAGSLADAIGLPEVAKAARAAVPPAHRVPSDLLLDGFATRFTDGYAAAAPVLRRALKPFREGRISAEDELRWSCLACRAALELWDDGMWDLLAMRQVELARDTGALTLFPIALSVLLAVNAFTEGLATAMSLSDEVREASEAVGSELPPYGSLIIAAWQGRETEGPELITESIDAAASRGEGLGLAAAHWASAMLYNGLGRYDDALAAAKLACEQPPVSGFYNWSLAELILAATRSGNVGDAKAALERLAEMTGASGTDWALGVEARSRALVSDGEIADSLYREAIERLARTRVRVELGRAHLLYGEWLRRERRRVEARGQLRTAQDMLAEMGVEAFAERARRELLATGDTAGKRTVTTRHELTAQEALIAQLASEGLSNPDIGARLFISPRTVKYHLRKVFIKLNISCRQELDLVLSDSAPTSVVGWSPSEASPHKSVARVSV